MERIDQVVFVSERGESHSVRLYPNIRPKQIVQKLLRANLGKIAYAYSECNDADFETYNSILKEAFPNAKLTESTIREPGQYTARGKVSFVLTEDYFRAIAKIAFHYYLTHSARGAVGDEPEFAPLRDFIRGGGDPTQFFSTPSSTFRMPFGPTGDGRALVPAQWHHILAFDESSATVVGYVQLCAGPKSFFPEHYVTIGKLDSKLTLPFGQTAHVYTYDSSVPGKSGFVEPASVRRVRGASDPKMRLAGVVPGSFIGFQN